MTPRAEKQLRLRTMALAAERRNKPSGLPALAIIALLAACVFAIFSANGAAAARSNLKSTLDAKARIDVLVLERARLTEMQRANAPAQVRYRPLPNLLTRLLDQRREMELPEGTISVKERSQDVRLAGRTDSPFRGKGVTANMVDLTLDEAMEWINRVIANVDGLFVRDIEFRPSPRGWSIEVEFLRWEKQVG